MAEKSCNKNLVEVIFKMASDGKFLEEVVFNRFNSLSTYFITDDEGEYCEEIRRYKVEKHYSVYDYKAMKNRYIDIALILPNNTLTVIECKDNDNGRKKDESVIDNFYTLLLCANANRGLIVSTHGFAEPAVTKAHNLPGMAVYTLTLEEFERYATFDYNYYNSGCPVCKGGHVDFRDFVNVQSIDGKYFKIFNGVCDNCFTTSYLNQYHTKTVITPILNIDEAMRKIAKEREVPCGDKSSFVYVVNSDATICFKYKGEYCKVHSFGRA